MIHGTIEASYDHGSDMIVTRCPLCQSNVETYQGEFNAKFGGNFEMPVVYYRQLKSVAYGRTAEGSAIDGQFIKAKKLEEIAAK
jgi:heterodisulfide reductase subunit B